MVWLILTDEQWSRMEPHCLGKPRDPGRNGTDNRMFMEAVPSEGKDRQSIAGFAGDVWQMEYNFQAVQ